MEVEAKASQLSQIERKYKTLIITVMLFAVALIVVMATPFIIEFHRNGNHEHYGEIQFAI